jgi:hypothetical protein
MVSDKTEEIRIRCTEELKLRWETFRVGSENNAEALEELLDEHGDSVKKARTGYSQL